MDDLSNKRSERAAKFALYGATNVLQYRFNRLRNHLAEVLPFPRIVRARLRQKKYAHIIPIGINCETAFRFYRKWKFLDSSLFAWTNSRNLATLTETLADLPRLLGGEMRFDPKSRMWICERTKIGLHGKLNLASDVVPTSEEIAADLTDLRGRVAHLKEKLLNDLSDEKSTLLVHRLAFEDMSASDLSDRLDRLQRTLADLGSRNCTLLVICEKPFLSTMPSAPNRIFRPVNLFNAMNHAADKNVGDAVGWQAIFTEFAPEKILPKAHKFKFE